MLGQHALAWHLPQHRGPLTDAVRQWRDHGSTLLVLPHPSPRNNGWLHHNPWFDSELLPELRSHVARALG